jgi:hypothetical protein
MPHLVIPTNSKAEGLCYLHVEDVESICASSDLGKKATMEILNSHDSVLDLHTRTVLIQQSQADDRVSQRGDVIDSSEQSVLTRLGGEDDRADALDLHAGGIPKLNESSDIGVKLSEDLPSTDHVMGGTGVEAPPINLVVAGAITEEGVCSRLIKVEENRCGRCRWR